MAEEDANKKDFFGGLMNAFKERWQVDVWLKAGDQTDAIPAHKLILGARSKVFKNILGLDDYKTSSVEKITLSEMTHDELETFLEFIYNGSIPDTKLMQHVRALYLAAHKYEIPYLQDLCRKQLIVSMNSLNVFDLVELAEIASDKILKDAVSEFITRHMEEISLSSKFMSFVESNPALTVETIRGYVNNIKDDRNTTSGASGQDQRRNRTSGPFERPFVFGQDQRPNRTSGTFERAFGFG